MSQQSLNQEKDEKSSKTSVVLVISDPRINYGHLPKTRHYLTTCVNGAIFWLTESGLEFDEVWLDTEIKIDAQPDARLKDDPYTMKDGRILCDYLKYYRNLCPKNLKTIRVMTKNPAHIDYIRTTLGDIYKLCFNLPKNQAPAVVKSTKTQ